MTEIELENFEQNLINQIDLSESEIRTLKNYAHID